MKNVQQIYQRATLYISVVMSLLLLIASAMLQDQLLQSRGHAHAASTKPNIVFILTDDETMESVAKMPYLSSRKDWISFDNAFLNVSLCCPSRSSILTGQYDTHTGVLDNGGLHDGQQLNEKNTLPVWLHQAGYHTALIGKYLNQYPWNRGHYVPPGWDDWHAFIGWDGGYYNYRLNENGVVHSYGASAADYSTDVFAAKAVDFLHSTPSPFFLYFAPHAPHGPFMPAPRHRGVYAHEPVIHDPSFNEADVSDKPAFVRNLRPLTPSSLDAGRRLQWEMMLAVDEGIKHMDETLVARGLLNNTVEVFMTDNGYAFGEHRWRYKRCEYAVCMRTPLMIRYPGLPARHLSQLAQNIDIAPTIADIAGVTPGLAEDGRSLLPLLRGNTTSWRTELLQHWGGGGPPGVLGYPPNFWSIRTERYLYVELVTGEKELYDYAVDPYELTNQAGKPAYAAVQRNLATRLAALIKKATS